MTLKMTSISFVNPSTGEKVEAVLSEGYQLVLKQPFNDNQMSADFLAGTIFAGAYASTKEFHADKSE